MSKKRKLKLWAKIGIFNAVIALVSIAVWFLNGSPQGFIVSMIIYCLILIITGVLFTGGQKLGFFEDE